MEYGRDGRVVKGVDKAPTRTKYEEDVYVNNHTSVWGSYYRYFEVQFFYSFPSFTVLHTHPYRCTQPPAAAVGLLLLPLPHAQLVLHRREGTCTPHRHPTEPRCKPTSSHPHPTCRRQGRAANDVTNGQNVDVYQARKMLEGQVRHPLPLARRLLLILAASFIDLCFSPARPS